MARVSEAVASARVDQGEVARFDALADEWWNEKGPMRPLHTINPVRLDFLRQRICAHFNRDPRALDAFSGLTILDIGCGGGILTEPLARMGATVTGVEPAAENVAIARQHAEEQGLSIEYINGLAEDLVAAGRTFDIVLAMEVVEHVPDVPGFVSVAAALVRPGGFFGASTLNRTLRSFALAVVGAEYVLRWLPVGTHRWEKFVTPHEFVQAIDAAGLTPHPAQGMIYNPLGDRWLLAGDTAVNYFITASRRPAGRAGESQGAEPAAAKSPSKARRKPS